MRSRLAMKSLPAKLAIIASIAASSCTLSARTCPLDSLSCLFQLTKPIREQRAIRFSFSPFAERMAAHAIKRTVIAALSDFAEPAQPQGPARTEFTANSMRPVRSLEGAEPIDHWPFFDALRKWQSNPQIQGLSHSFSNPRSYVALDYSDIFETGRAAYKGGHGVSLFFRHVF
jgi:hypothetical protein